MKNKFYAAWLLLTAIAPSVGETQTQNIPQGQYNGVLTTSGGKLELSIKLTEQNGMMIAKMDVPAQGAKDIPATKTLIKNDSLLLDFAMMRAVYRGVYNKDSLAISGQWAQGPYKFPLQLFMAKNGNNKTLKKQEPLPPFDYNTEEVTFENKKAGIKIAGTLSYPELKTNLTTVILITGSGAQNRDEEIMGHKPFLVIADYLTRNGYAVLRCDDRGIGGTGGNPAESTSLDFATDVEAAMDYLKTRKELNPKKLGLMGHSEGGAIAPIIAARNKTVAFVIMLAGPGINCMDLLVLQAVTLSKTMGLDENTIATNSKLNRSIYKTALKNENNAAQIIKSKLLEAGMPEKGLDAQVNAMLSPWYRTFLSINPAEYLPKVKCPVLALNGKKDLQVPYKEDLENIEKLLSKNKHHQTKAYENLNHLFQHCETGLPSEYGSNEETFSPEVLIDIVNWLNQLN